MVLRTDQLLNDRYVIGERLGGVAGVQTFAALDQAEHAPVVVKEMTLRDLDNWKAYDLFEREAKALANLHHPRIPRLVQYFKLEDARKQRLYLVMDRAPGRSLAVKMGAGWWPTEKEVRSIAQQVLEILEYLHSLNPAVIHRDIKPGNLILDDEGLVYLVDFGGVTEALRPEGGSTIVGTFGYMAPEQFAGKAVPASDLYSLGATLVHLLSGISPDKLPQKALKLDFKDKVRCSEHLEAWLDRLLEPEIGKRFGAAKEARNALTQHLRARDAQDRYEQLVPRKRKPISNGIATKRLAIAVILAFPLGYLLAKLFSLLVIIVLAVIGPPLLFLYILSELGISSVGLELIELFWGLISKLRDK